MLRKQFITITSIILFIAIIIIAFLFLQKKQQFDNNDPIYAIPLNATFIIQINQPSQFFYTIQDQGGFTKELEAFDSYRTIKSIISLLDTTELFNSSIAKNLKKQAFTLSLHYTNDSAFNWMINKSIQNKQELNELKRIVTSNTNKLQANKNNSYFFSEIEFNELEKIPIYCSFNNKILTLTSSPSLIEASLLQRQKGQSLMNDKGFSKIQKTSFISNTATAYINYKYLTDFTSELFDAPFLQNVSEWTELDINIKKDAIYFNGFTYGGDYKYFTKLFNGIDSKKSSLADILPASTKFLIAYTFSSSNKFKENLNLYRNELENQEAEKNILSNFRKKYNTNIEDVFFSFIEDEFALTMNLSQNEKEYYPFLVVKTKGQSKTLEDFKNLMPLNNKEAEVFEWVVLDSQTKFPVYSTPNTQAIEALLSPLFSLIPIKYFTFFRNYLIFGNSIESIEEFLYANVLNKTLAAHSYYSLFLEKFSYQENFFMFAEIPHIYKLSGDYLNHDIFNPTSQQIKSLENFYGIGIQMSTANDLIYTSISADYAPHRDKEPRTIWQSRIDSTIIGKPVLVDNHNTKEKEILVQDALNNLYLINNMGRILWKRPIDGQILNEIVQIDYYKNNKLQYLFNTADKIYLLDRNGNHVARYPINLPSKATNGIAVFDYDNNKDYRIFIALEDRQIYLFDKTGNINPGWNRPQTEGLVITPIQYFRNQGKDYIVFSDEFRNYILDRKGFNRINPEKNFIRNSESLFFLEGENSSNAALVSSTKNGELAKIFLPDGKTTIKKLLKEAENHHFILLNENSQNPEYLFTTKHQLQRFNKTGEKTLNIEFENELIPLSDIYRFSASDIKYGLVEKNDGHIHLINSDGSYYRGFPLSGMSRFSIGFLHSTAYRFNLITGGSHNYIYNYRVE